MPTGPAALTGCHRHTARYCARLGSTISEQEARFTMPLRFLSTLSALLLIKSACSPSIYCLSSYENHSIGIALIDQRGSADIDRASARSVLSLSMSLLPISPRIATLLETQGTRRSLL